MEKLFKYFLGLIAVVYVMAMITLERYPNLPDNNVSIGDLANIMVGLMAIATLGFSIWDRAKTTQKHNSSIALESYISSIDSLVGKLSDPRIDSGTKFLLIDTCHKNLVLCQGSITEDEHQLFAKNRYEILRTHLNVIYFELQIEDFLIVPPTVKEEYNLSNYSHSFSASSYLLVSSWLKYVVPNSSFYDRVGRSSYGHFQSLSDDYALSLLSLLVAEPLCVKPSSELRNCFGQFTKTCEIDIQQADLYRSFHQYPSLAAHLMLHYTCLVSRSNDCNYPKLRIAVHDIDTNIWVSFKGGNFRYNLGIDEKLACLKYLEKR